MKKVNNLKNALFNHKYMINPMNYIKPSFINSDGKSNNINQEMKLRSTKPNFNGSNKIVIIANNNKSSSNDNKSNKNSNNNNLNTSINNNKSDDMKKTVTSNFSNEEAFPLEKHIDLCFVSYAYNENANLEHRKEMEDFHYIKALLSKKLSCSYFGLFDGHSGKEVGMYLMENLHKIIHQKIKENNDIENIDNLKNIVINSFEQIDQEINSKNFKNETGSTGTVLLLYKDKNSPLGKSLLCANVGDSKAYLITKKEMILITKDHKCCDANEVKRIRDSGGIVFRERVFGTLMLTRSFGDKEMKKYGVLSTPDIFMKNIDTEDIFVVIASDGVWDVVEENEILKMSQGSISSNDFSKKIINLAKERDTHDNISCIVIKLNKNN
jgi:protein phosphatase PTC1